MKKQPTQNEQYKTLLVLVAGFTVLGLVTHKPYWPFAADIIAIAALISPLALRYIVLGWTKLGEMLGWVNSRIILSVIFFVVLTPIAVAYRATNKNPFRLKRNDDSLFTERNHLYVSKDLKNTW